jgi:hypothetical protein
LLEGEQNQSINHVNLSRTALSIQILRAENTLWISVRE